MNEASVSGAGEARNADEPTRVNLAPSARASQSSTSRWSRADDASGALRPHRRPFGFHTDLDDGPWWRLEFATPCAPDRIVVHNRRDTLQDRASGLIVEASLDGESWTLLHQGLCHFGAGSGPGDPPLVLPLGGRLELRFLRLRLPGRSYLHLGWVEVLATQPEFTFLAMRGDGFGSRLRAILHAATLAEHFGGEFRMAWPRMREFDAAAHTVQPVEQTFAPEFLARHRLSAPEALGRFTPLRNDLVLETARDIRVESYPLERMAPGVAARIAPGAGRRAFARLRFAAPLERARQAALDVPIPGDASAIHLRAGDIIYGPYRFLGHFASKATAYPLGLELTRKLRGEGQSILLFGQDAALCRHITRLHDAVFVGDLVEELAFDRHQATLFEITLMSRCGRIFASKSAFAAVAAQIAGVSVHGARGGLRPRDIRRGFLQALETPDGAVSDLQKAFAFWTAIRHLRSLFEPDELSAFLGQAIALDPENALYRLFRVREHLVGGRMERAGQELDATARETQESLLFLLTSHRVETGSLLETLVESLDPLAEAGHPVVPLCRALIATDPQAVQAAARRFLATRPPDLMVFDPKVVRLISG